MVDTIQYIIFGIITGIMGIAAVPLSGFIRKIEDGHICRQCELEKKCFARKPLEFRKSNYVSEFMLLSYYKVQKYCKCVKPILFQNGLAYILVNVMLVTILFWSKGWNLTGILFSIVVSALLSLSIVDWNTQYIPLEYTAVIFGCGLIRLFADFSNWLNCLIGLIAVSGFLCVVNWISTPMLRKRYQGEREIDSGLGDGDIKLMAATGLLLGWKLNFLALGIGCIAGSVIHLILMRIKEGDRQFALGPYLSLGVYITMICGEQLVGWYLNMVGVKPL